MITLTDNNGNKFDVEAASITKVEALNPLSALAHKAKTLITIDNIGHTMVKEDPYTVMNMVIRGIMA
ncbi:hypothetical protein [Ruminococcus sp.]|uniref:hypothetical protein n=1 Tax=Ruminococcus sp. TaxID=41978 RepID=UPI001B60FC45|nr:hypothetical protein [Ruminococcus sp.]MBP5431588.1 hypothetical protein [Ruminococcus sp.]